MSTLNWPEVLAGFIFGLLPLAARHIAQLARHPRRQSQRKFLGAFWVYHRSTTGSGRVFERRLLVRSLPLLDQLAVYAHDVDTDPSGKTTGDDAHLAYIGSISQRQGMVRYINLHDPHSHERLTWYIIDPFYNPFTQTIGLYLALDLEGFPAAGPLILSRNRLPHQQVEAQLGEHVLRTGTAPRTDNYLPPSEGADGTEKP